MRKLFETIKRLVAEGRYVVGEHAVERLEERRILEWQIVDGVRAAVLLDERPHDKPNPSIEVRQLLADGTEVKVVSAKLVTVHFFDH